MPIDLDVDSIDAEQELKKHPKLMVILIFVQDLGLDLARKKRRTLIMPGRK